MKKDKDTSGLIIFLLAAVIVHFVSAGQINTVSNLPTAKELLDKFAENQGKVDSYIIKCEIISNQNDLNKGDPALVMKSGKHKSKQILEIRCDGSRVSSRLQTWNDNDLDANLNPKSTASRNYTSFLWNGKDFFDYSIPSIRYGGPGQINRQLDKDDAHQIALGSTGLRQFQGYLISPRSNQRIDSHLLREAKQMSVINKTEAVGGVDCFVIDADSISGKYSIWIDPLHGYNISKSLVHNRSGDVIENSKIAADVVSSYEITRFEKINNIWFPMEASAIKKVTYRYGNFSEISSRFRITNLELNPDHNALHSFEPNDIPNGTGFTVVNYIGFKFTWQDGKLIDEDGKVTIDLTEKNK